MVKTLRHLTNPSRGDAQRRYPIIDALGCERKPILFLLSDAARNTPKLLGSSGNSKWLHYAAERLDS